MRRAEIEGRINAIQKAIKDNADRAHLLLMVSDSTRRLMAGEKLNQLTDDPLAVLQLQEQTLLEEYGPSHPQVKSIRKRIEAFQAYNKKVGREERGVLLDPIEGHLQFLKQELEGAKAEEEGIVSLLKSEQSEATKQIGAEVQDETYRAEILRSQQLFETIIKRLTEINLLKDLGGYHAQNIAPASTGGAVASRAQTILGVAACLGLLCGLGLAYLAELADQSFRTPDEIRTRLGLSVIGHVPFFASRQHDGELTPTPDGKVLEPMLSAFYRPKSIEAEAYRGIRTSLSFSMRGELHKLIQVTSPDMGDGKSTLAANLAVSIAQTGKKVILIDADFRRPRVHKIFGVSGSGGLAAVIGGEGELADAIRPTVVPNLSILPCGPHPDNPAELLSSPRFKEFLNVMREQFDYVLIDTPPLLAVTDPCVVVPHVNGVILTIRIAKNARLHASRAKEILATLGANVLGVVVNEVNRSDSSDYGYAGYRYGYGYTYKYYAGDKKNYAYRTETPDDQAPKNGTANHDGSGSVKPATANGDQRASAPEPNGQRKPGFWRWLLRV